LVTYSEVSPSREQGKKKKNTHLKGDGGRAGGP